MMIERLNFYARHSINDLRVNGQRTFFALLCIAAGVAAIVSLGTLASMIEGTLTGNLQVSNRADIQIDTLSGFRAGNPNVEAQLNAAVEAGDLDAESTGLFGGNTTSYTLTLSGVETLRDWFDAQLPGSALTYRLEILSPIELFFGTGAGGSISVPATGASVNQLSPIVIESARYPLYGQIVSQDGTPLAQLLSAPTDIVLSDRVARDLSANVGDTVRISGADGDFTVRGIIDESQEITSPTQTLEALFGFYMLDTRALDLFPNVEPRVSRVYARLPDASTTSEALNDANVDLRVAFPYLDITTTEDLRADYEQIASSIDQLTGVMGLVSILIGSIGIVNTMQVIVRRRTLEVAVLKTIGLQGNQVTVLFLVEALIMGVIGSIAGVLLGWGLVFVIRGTAERLVGQNLPFAIDLPSAINGVIIGIAVTAVFGFLPTLTAGRVRPGLVLRPSENLIPRTGCLPVIGALALIIVVMSLVASTILGSVGTAFGVIIGAFIAAGVLYGLLSLMIWLVGRFFPSLGSVDLKISLRQMLAGRGRAAMTLLALVIGVFSLSLITLLADSINGLLRFALNEASGGNIVISAANPSSVGEIEAILNDFDGLNRYSVARTYTPDFVGVQEGETRLTVDDLNARLDANAAQIFPLGGPDADEFQVGDLLNALLRQIGAQDLAALPERTMESGRNFTAADAGARVITLSSSNVLRGAGIDVGDQLLYTFDGEEVAYTVIGIAAPSLIGGGFGSSTVSAPADSFPTGFDPASTLLIADVVEERLPELRRALGVVRGTFVIETAAFTQLIQSLLGAFTAFPTMVALLGLVVGGVVIANSVALTTMERRKEIAVMKSVGLQRERVLFMILLENGILGVIGGLIGVGIGLVGLVIAVSSFQGPSQAVPYGAALVLMLLCIGVALLAALTTAWGASGEKPLNVLRYE
jgi:putative ABC transport system permease protein